MNTFLKKFQQKFKTGFTLIETLVAVTIITIVMAVALGGIQQSLQSSSFSRDQITAFYLAEEAIEYLRQIRDTNLNSGNSWLSGIDSNCLSGSACLVDTVNQTLAPCSGTACTLRYHRLNDNPSSNTWLYDYGTNEPLSKFTRTLVINQVTTGSTTGNELKVTATVTWQTGPFKSNSYSLTENMYNWKH